jgi:two-component system, response regulator
VTPLTFAPAPTTTTTMKPCILWVEDNASDVLLVRDAVNELGFDVELVVAANALEAFKYMEAREPFVLRREPPDLILVDINLPGIKGMAVIDELRRHRDWQRVPCVVLTSSSNPKELQACRDLGAIACITKPSTFEGYLEVIPRLRIYLPRAAAPAAGSDPLQAARAAGREANLTVTGRVLDDLAEPPSHDARPASG